MANISHEIRTPLYAINALAELCLSRPYMPQEIREHIQMINESGTSLLRLLNDVIDARRLEAGKMELHCQDVDVLGLARFSLKMFVKQVGPCGGAGRGLGGRDRPRRFLSARAAASALGVPCHHGKPPHQPPWR